MQESEGSRGATAELVKSVAECERMRNMFVQARPDKVDQTATCKEAPNEGSMEAFFIVDTFTCASVK